jgi:hypothetical protein
MAIYNYISKYSHSAVLKFKSVTTGKNAKMAILRFAVIYFFTRDYYKGIPFQ